jgi:DNA-binding winged helix-turn-helix (wHTH) protein
VLCAKSVNWCTVAEAEVPVPERAEQAQWRFGVFEVDLRTGELRKHGVRIALQQKPLQVLEALLTRSGQGVTREELRKALWADATFVDFDHSINIAISKLRRALSDPAKNPRFIETLSRHGYRFIAPVHGQTPAAPSQRKTMLAVLPIQNLSGDPEQNYFSDGLTEEMISQLGHLDPRRLGVIARTTVMHYKDTALGANEIGKELGVDYILEGSLRRSADRVRITAQRGFAAN